jgi:serine/threonine protein kinase
MADRSGERLGNYRLVRLLGEGGFAEVYLGEHTYLGTQAAIKLLYMRVGQDDIGQFQQEGRTLANLIHPHIVRVLDFGVEDRTPYLIMDYAPGGSLRTRHAKGSRLPLPTVVEYIQQVAQALQYAHDRKLIHRDVKPENMLIGRNGEILLSDFGIALIAQSSRYQSTKDMAGTISYMAPEQLEGHPRTASDQYALGIVAYEWLSGRRPFYGSFTEVAAQHHFTPPPSLLAQMPTLSPMVEQVIFTALAKKPEERFASVSAFAKALAQAGTDAPAQPSQPRAMQPSPQPATSGLIQRSTITPAASPSSVHEALALPVAQSMPGSAPRIRTPVPAQKKPFIYRGHKSAVTAVAWSPDGRRMASSSYDSTVQLWNASDGSHLFTYKGHRAPVFSVAWSPDGTRIASSSWDMTVQIWDANNGRRLLTYKGHRGGLFSVAWSPDGTRIASSSNDDIVQVWNASDGSELLTYKGHRDSVNAVTWSLDGIRIASGSADKTVQVWNASDGSELLTCKGHRDSVNAVAWSPDGMLIASGSYDKVVQVWNASDGSRLLTYKGHSEPVNAVAWSPDGTRIASASVDSTVQIWNVSNGSQLLTYKRHSNFVNTVAWSPDDKGIASGSWDTTVQVWSAP